MVKTQGLQKQANGIELSGARIHIYILFKSIGKDLTFHLISLAFGGVSWEENKQMKLPSL